MNASHPVKPRPSGTQGLRALVSAAALAATLGGWAVFSLEQALAARRMPAGLALQLPPMPTLVSPLNLPAAAASSQPAAAPSLRPVSLPAAPFGATAPLVSTRSSR
jgi:hypothetical protein